MEGGGWREIGGETRREGKGVGGREGWEEEWGEGEEDGKGRQGRHL